MIGKTIFFNYRNEEVMGEVIDKILMCTGCGYPETGYLVLVQNFGPVKVRIDDITRVVI